MDKDREELKMLREAVREMALVMQDSEENPVSLSLYLIDIVAPTDIKNLRKKWKLSQRAFAKIIGWSPSTIALYEAGEIPTTGNNRLLKILIKDSKVMEEFIQESKNDDKLEL